MSGRRLTASPVSRAALLVIGCGLVASVTAESAPRDAVSTLAGRLERNGRAETRFERRDEDLEGKPRIERGRLVLELPDRVALSFTRTGERLTVRRNGGEWLQPPLRQMITLDSSRAAVAGRWWRLLLEGEAPGLETRKESRRVVVISANDANGPTVTIELGTSGLPTRLDIHEGDSRVSFRFLGWTFARPRGPGEFRQKAPAGYTVSELP